MDLSEEALKKKLTPEQYHVLREAGTEAPYSDASKLLYNEAAGTYVCPVCGNELFDSETKFPTYDGWPDFYQAKPGAVTLHKDISHGMVRTEVRCAKCGSHLGHVFDDAPEQPTGQRFCINSAALNFKANE
jgi:peptide-methionine (R)-S-oxide reductase